MKPVVLAVLLLALAPASAAANKPTPLRVTIIRAECPDQTQWSDGCAYPDGRVYVAPGTNRFLLDHEMGHEFDFQRLTPGDRHWFARMLHVRGPWSDWKREVFADAYANCARGLSRASAHGAIVARYDGGHGYNPTPSRHKAICAGIARIAMRPAR